MNVAIYVRVSTQEQKAHGISVEAQEAVCREWVKENRHRLVGVYNDAGLSARAKYKKRTAMLHLIDDMRSGKIDLIVFTKLDRWFRNVADYYEVQAILEECHVKWRAIQEDYETETASGRFKVNIMLAVAQDEADRTSERIKATSEYKRQKGEAVGRAPVGYIIKDKHFEIDPVTEPAIRAFFDTYMETFSQQKARQAAQALGVSMNQTRASRTLRNKTYCGDHFGVPCPMYITPEQFSKVRQVIDSHVREPRVRHTYLFSGLLKCGLCGGPLTSSAPYQKDRIRRIKAYRCSNHVQYFDRCPEGTYSNESKLEAYLLDNLPALLDNYRIELQSISDRQKDYLAEIKSLEGKLSRLKDLYIDGEISRESYDHRSASIRDQLSPLQELLCAPALSPDAYQLPDNWLDMYWTLTDVARRQFWHDIIKQIIIYRDRPPEVLFY